MPKRKLDRIKKPASSLLQQDVVSKLMEQTFPGEELKKLCKCGETVLIPKDMASEIVGQCKV